MWSRRHFLEQVGASTLAVPAAAAIATDAVPAKPRKRLAIITTVWTYQSHAQHMGDRFLVGYPEGGEWHRPEMDVVAVYVDQKPDGDQSVSRAAEFGFRLFPTIEETLRVGGAELAVDGVLIIGEHGEYPRNERGQIEYPRYEFFRRVAQVFEADRRAVPVFNDKHLSYRFEWAREMVETSRRLKFPFMAGSSLPVTWRLPSVEMPWGATVSEALMVGVGGSDPMDFHALEAMQCMVERRRGGETGVRSVQLVDGPAVWEAGEKGVWSPALLDAALSRSNELQGLTRVDARPQDLLGSGQLRRLVEHPAAYLIEYLDGTRATLLMLNGAVGDFTFAARLEPSREILSTLFYLPPTPNVQYSAELMHRVAVMFEEGRALYPVERTLLTSGVLESCLESRRKGNVRLDTPHLAVQYAVEQASQFAQR